MKAEWRCVQDTETDWTVYAKLDDGREMFGEVKVQLEMLQLARDSNMEWKFLFGELSPVIEAMHQAVGETNW